MARRFAMYALALAAAAAPVLAQPITVAPGNDGWNTPANSSQIDLSVFPIDSFFGPGAVLSPTIVSLSGVPLDSADLGSIDTLLERPSPSSPVTFTSYPETHSFDVQLKALRLHGNVSINGVPYDLVVALSEAGSGTGSITATRLTADGGRFSSSFPVVPKLVFTDGSTQVVIDCGYVAGCPSPLTLGSSNVCWVVAHGPGSFDPTTKGVTPIHAGIAVDGTYNGVNDYTTVGKKEGLTGLEFHTGFDDASPWNACGGVTHNHAVYSLTHVANTPTDCATTTSKRLRGKALDSSGGTVTPISETLCPIQASPVPGDPSQPVQPADPTSGTLKKRPVHPGNSGN
jgi:hypothetical protein